MDVIVVLIISIVAGIVAMAIYEAIKAPIRRYFRKRVKEKEVSLKLPDIPQSEVMPTDVETRELKPKKKEKEVPPEEILEVIEVDPGCHETKTIFLRQGSRVSGLAEEVYGLEFSLYVVDGEGYSDFVNKDSFNALFWVENRTAIAFDFHVPKTDKWYFVFDAYRKQYPREIEFDCRIRPAS